MKILVLNISILFFSLSYSFNFQRDVGNLSVSKASNSMTDPTQMNKNKTNTNSDSNTFLKLFSLSMSYDSGLIKFILEKSGFLVKPVKEAAKSFDNSLPKSEYDKKLSDSIRKDLDNPNSNEKSKLISEINDKKRKNECIQDYSKPCPQRFVAISSQCWPTDSYTGPCNRVQNGLNEMSDDQKRVWSNTCDCKWPCMQKKCINGMDYDHSCPIGYTETESFKCEIDVEDVLLPEIIILRSKEDKINFVLNYKGLFPCKRDICRRNYEDPCPQSWAYNREKKICSSSVTYIGPCPKYFRSDLLNTEQLKRNLEIVCFVNYPCINDCERNYIDCPLGYSNFNDQCVSLSNSSKCELLNLENLSLEEKINEVKQCGTNFRCKNRKTCLKDYKYPCPIDYKLTEDKNSCVPISSIGENVASCKFPKNVNQLNLSNKRLLEISCGFDWPCKGELNETSISV